MIVTVALRGLKVRLRFGKKIPERLARSRLMLMVFVPVVSEQAEKDARGDQHELEEEPDDAPPMSAFSNAHRGAMMCDSGRADHPPAQSAGWGAAGLPGRRT